MNVSNFRTNSGERGHAECFILLMVVTVILAVLLAILGDVFKEDISSFWTHYDSDRDIRDSLTVLLKGVGLTIGATLFFVVLGTIFGRKSKKIDKLSDVIEPAMCVSIVLSVFVAFFYFLTRKFGFYAASAIHVVLANVILWGSLGLAWTIALWSNYIEPEEPDPEKILEEDS